MKVYVGRRLDGMYEITHDYEDFIEWDKKNGFTENHILDVIPDDFHKISTLRLQKGQMKEFDRVEFK